MIEIILKIRVLKVYFVNFLFFFYIYLELICVTTPKFTLDFLK
jgi:hypothetical protein